MQEEYDFSNSKKNPYAGDKATTGKSDVDRAQDTPLSSAPNDVEHSKTENIIEN